MKDGTLSCAKASSSSGSRDALAGPTRAVGLRDVVASPVMVLWEMRETDEEEERMRGLGEVEGGGEADGDRGGGGEGRDVEGEGPWRCECESSKREGEDVASRSHTSGGADLAACSFIKCLK